jgi:hypothetical protein
MADFQRRLMVRHYFTSSADFVRCTNHEWQEDDKILVMLVTVTGPAESQTSPAHISDIS